MQQHDLGSLADTLLEENPHISRRELLKMGVIGASASLLPSCATLSNIPPEDMVSIKKFPNPTAKNIERKGAELFCKWDVQRAPGCGTYDRHRRINDPGGLDFDISKDNEIYPVASGRVLEIDQGAGAGKVVAIYHGLYYSVYIHLARNDLVNVGQQVTRKDRIAIGGRTGSGANSGAHLHLFFRTREAGALINTQKDLASNGIHYNFDPVDFAASKAKDAHGEYTLPYWHGDEVDGPLDRLYDNHFQEKLSFFNSVLRMLPKRKSTSSHIGSLLMVDIYNNIRGGEHTFSKGFENEILKEIKEFLSFPPMLTAPFKNPYASNLYK